MESAETPLTAQEIRRRLQQEIKELEEELNTVEQRLERTVIERVIVPELRSIINRRLPSYTTSLTISTAPGLAEVFDPAYEITTESKEKLRRLLGNMPGGSIGITGPRGVGKTTLLDSFCGKASTTELKERPVLSVMTSAPVQYDAREFILHIFSSVCQRALELKNRDPHKNPRPPLGLHRRKAETPRYVLPKGYWFEGSGGFRTAGHRFDGFWTTNSQPI
jgi:hypothetical protein